ERCKTVWVVLVIAVGRIARLEVTDGVDVFQGLHPLFTLGQSGTLAVLWHRHEVPPWLGSYDRRRGMMPSAHRTSLQTRSAPYRHEAVAALLAAAARGVQRPLLVLPTGTGKTIIFALLVQRRGGRALILAHRDELIQQAVDKLHLVDPTMPLGVVQAERDELTAPTVVASVQTLSRRPRLPG